MRRFLPPLVAAALLAVGCTDTAGPLNDGSRLKAAAAAPGSGIVLDRQVGTLNEQNFSVLAKGFNPTNPHVGDAIVATFVWTGPATITAVTDFQTDANHTPVGNTFHLVESVTTGGISMATYVATNVTGFPDPNPDQTIVYAVQATMSQSVPDGGAQLTAYSGVASLFSDAVGGHSSGSGTSASTTVADPGAISVPAGGAAYAVTMSNGLVGRSTPSGYTNINTMSDAMMVSDAEYMIASAAGSTDPQWTWFFGSSSSWLASVLALKPSPTNQPPTAAFTSSCTSLSCSFTSTSSDPDGTIASYAWTFGDGGTATVQNPSHTYGVGGTNTVTLTVTDNQGATNAVSHFVTVTAPNQPPVAAFTSSCSNLGCTFTSSSTDPDGRIASYAWTFGDGGTSTLQNPSHSYGAGGTYTVTLTVTDNQGATNTVVHTVTVNQPPVVNAGSNQTVVLGVLYTVHASFNDPDNGPWTYTIDWGDGTSTTGSASVSPGTIARTHTYVLLGNYTIRVTVTDSRGASGSGSKVLTVIL
jgi:PKD repeat protein